MKMQKEEKSVIVREIIKSAEVVLNMVLTGVITVTSIVGFFMWLVVTIQR